MVSTANIGAPWPEDGLVLGKHSEFQPRPMAHPPSRETSEARHLASTTAIYSLHGIYVGGTEISYSFETLPRGACR